MVTSKQTGWLAVVGLVLASSSGCAAIVNDICCLHDRWYACYAAKTFQDCGCGETYYGEWHSDPPDCYDPCDNCGNFIGRQYWAGCQSCRPGGHQWGQHAPGPMMSNGDMEMGDVSYGPEEVLPAPAQSPTRAQPFTPGPSTPSPRLQPPPQPPRPTTRRPSRQETAMRNARASAYRARRNRDDDWPEEDVQQADLPRQANYRWR